MQLYSNESFFTPTGWECPKCGRVYSPSTPFCYYCGNNTITTTTTSNKSEKNIDIWAKSTQDVNEICPYYQGACSLDESVICYHPTSSKCSVLIEYNTKVNEQLKKNYKSIGKNIKDL